MTTKSVCPSFRNCGIRQVEISERTGVSTASVSRIAHGQQNLSVKTLAKLAHELGVTPAQLLTEILEKGGAA